MIKKIMCIYSITNIINGKIYIGSTINFKSRKTTHLRNLLKLKHHSLYLQNSYNKYGKENFKFDILEIVLDKDFLIQKEQYYLDKFKPKLNMTLTAGLNSHLGLKRDKSICEKISNSLKGKPLSKEHRLKISNTIKGTKLSQETKDKIKKSLGEKLNKPIQQIDKQGNIIEWKSATFVKETLGFSSKKIRDCVNGKIKTYRGFIWISKN